MGLRRLRSPQIGVGFVGIILTYSLAELWDRFVSAHRLHFQFTLEKQLCGDGENPLLVVTAPIAT